MWAMAAVATQSAICALGIAQHGKMPRPGLTGPAYLLCLPWPRHRIRCECFSKPAIWLSGDALGCWIRRLRAVTAMYSRCSGLEQHQLLGVSEAVGARAGES